MKNAKSPKGKPATRQPPQSEWGIARCQDCDTVDSEEEFTPSDGRAHLVCPSCGGSNCFVQDGDDDPSVVAYWDADKLCKLGLSRPMIETLVSLTVTRLGCQGKQAVADAYETGAGNRLDEDDDDPNKDYRKKTCWE